MGEPASIPGTSRRLLIVAYHFPPQKGSSGLLRALKFSCYLPDRNWFPVVLSAHPRAYDAVDNSQIGEIHPQVQVIRTFTLDARRDLSCRGRYSRWLALPDRWVSWCLTAVPRGWLTIRRKNIDVIFTTFPIASAVLIGLFLHRLSGKPWVVDFRDSMTEDEYPIDRTTRRVFRWIEKQAVVHAARLIFTAPSTKKMYLERYPRLDAEKCLVIPNGYDEEDFRNLQMGVAERGTAGPLRLIHAGLVYPWERDPLPFFRALSRLRNEHRVSCEDLQIDLRGAGNETEYGRILRELGVDDMIHLLPLIPYHDALQESARADAMLLFQGASCNHQIPAKIYEYLRLQKPILALTDHAGDTATLLREAGGATIINMADEEAIHAGLSAFLSLLRKGQHPVPQRQVAERYSRRNQTYELACALNRILDNTAI
jgi:glycosyltransferase involved in cell wall biosynthesis